MEKSRKQKWGTYLIIIVSSMGLLTTIGIGAGFCVLVQRINEWSDNWDKEIIEADKQLEVDKAAIHQQIQEKYARSFEWKEAKWKRSTMYYPFSVPLGEPSRVEGKMYDTQNPEIVFEVSWELGETKQYYENYTKLVTSKRGEAYLLPLAQAQWEEVDVGVMGIGCPLEDPTKLFELDYSQLSEMAIGNATLYCDLYIYLENKDEFNREIETTKIQAFLASLEEKGLYEEDGYHIGIYYVNGNEAFERGFIYERAYVSSPDAIEGQPIATHFQVNVEPPESDFDEYYGEKGYLKFRMIYKEYGDFIIGRTDTRHKAVEAMELETDLQVLLEEKGVNVLETYKVLNAFEDVEHVIIQPSYKYALDEIVFYTVRTSNEDIKYLIPLKFEYCKEGVLIDGRKIEDDIFIVAKKE